MQADATQSCLTLCNANEQIGGEYVYYTAHSSDVPTRVQDRTGCTLKSGEDRDGMSVWERGGFAN